MSFLAMLGASVAGALTGSLGNSISNSISQAQQFSNNQALQNNSFQHDFKMLAAQVESSSRLAERQLEIRQQLLSRAGYTPMDAARGAVGAPTTKVLDWNGTRYYAPQAAITSSFSGGFSPLVVDRPRAKVTQQSSTTRRTSSVPSLASSGSWGQPQASLSTVSSRLTASSRSRSSRSPLPESWYTGPSRSLGPFAPGALQMAFVTPPGSVSSRSSARSSASTVSTVDERLLSSWKPFNLRNQPGFTRFHPRGSSNA